MDASAAGSGTLRQVADCTWIAQQARSRPLRRSEAHDAQIFRVSSQGVVESFYFEGESEAFLDHDEESREEIRLEDFAQQKAKLVFRYDRQR